MFILNEIKLNLKLTNSAKWILTEQAFQGAQIRAENVLCEVRDCYYLYQYIR